MIYSLFIGASDGTNRKATVAALLAKVTFLMAQYQTFKSYR